LFYPAFAETCVLVGGNQYSEAKHYLQIYFANSVTIFPEDRSSIFWRSTGNKINDRKIPQSKMQQPNFKHSEHFEY